MQNSHELFLQLTQRGGYVRLSDYFVLQLTGSDRAHWFHNFCTADIKAIAVGQGTEAFVLNAKGKTLAFVYVLATETELILLGLGDLPATLVNHLERFVIREDVRIAQVTSEYQVWGAGGDLAAELFSPHDDSPSSLLQHRMIQERVRVVATQAVSTQDWLAIGRSSELAEVETWLESAGLVSCSTGAWNAGRVRQLVPANGSEVTEDVLPQELQRDPTAISFHKGCYLGQETVARIDAMGRVNRLLTAVEWKVTDSIGVGVELCVDSKPIGKITSAAISLDQESVKGLAFVRRAHMDSGTILDTDHGSVTVC